MRGGRAGRPARARRVRRGRARDAGRAGSRSRRDRSAHGREAGLVEGGGAYDVLLACGVFGNLTDEDAGETIRLAPMLLAPNAAVVWTRGASVPEEPSTVAGDPAEQVRGLFSECGFVEEAVVQPDDAGFRVGVHRFSGAPRRWEPGTRFFSFV